MGNNAAYAAIESAAIALYNEDKLNLAALDAICEPWRGCDVDHGGSKGLETKDGLSLDELIVKLGRPFWWAKHPRPKNRRSKKWDDWISEIGWQEYEITRKRWEWC